MTRQDRANDPGRDSGDGSGNTAAGGAGSSRGSSPGSSSGGTSGSWYSVRSTWRSPAGGRELGLALLILAIAGVVGFHDPVFLTGVVWHDILVRCAPAIIVSCGVMIVVVLGDIDISVGSIMALLAALLGRTLSSHELQWSVWAGVPLVLLSGAMIGCVTGMLVTLGRVPSIIASLGMMTLLRGFATLAMGGKNIDGLPEAVVHASKTGWFGIPLGPWAALLVVLATYILLTRTALGVRIYATGSHPESAGNAGLPVYGLRIFAFCYAGFLTAVATVVDVPRLPKIESGIGSELELFVITSVVLSGVSISGGRGRLSGVVLAVVLLTLVRPVLTFLSVGEAGEKWTKAIHGLFILLAVVSDRFSATMDRRKKSR
ncbi:MAG: ABC transporter permease [Planctomycetes bacterium]|nr:ABC transporter permease [Planctomycetota bacterium]